MGVLSGKLTTNQLKLNELNVILLFCKMAVAGDVGIVISPMHFPFRPKVDGHFWCNFGFG